MHSLALWTLMCPHYHQQTRNKEFTCMVCVCTSSLVADRSFRSLTGEEITEYFYILHCRGQKSPLIFIIPLITSFPLFLQFPALSLRPSEHFLFNHSVITQPPKLSSLSFVHSHRSVTPQRRQVILSLLISTIMCVCVCIFDKLLCRHRSGVYEVQ